MLCKMITKNKNIFRIYFGFQMETFYIFSFHQKLSSQILSIILASFLRDNGNKSENRCFWNEKV